MTTNRHGALQTDEDMAHERVEWAVQRVGRVLMALLVAAAAIGLFGSGPVAARDEGTVSFDRFARRGAISVLALRVEAGRRVWLGAEVEDHAVIERVTPEPVDASLDDGRLVFRFEGAGPVHFELRPRGVGRWTLRLGRDGERELRLAQMVFP